MYVTRVIARGFKRGSFDVTLNRANVITGDNFAGKTQILDAIRLGLIGYLPELGNTPRATFGLASGPRLEVELHFDDGETKTKRSWWAEGNSVRSEHLTPSVLEGCALLGVMLNAEEYFGMGPLDRTRYVFANCPVDVITREKMAARVKAVAPDYDMAEVFAAVDQQAQESRQAPTPQEEIEFILKHVAEQWKTIGQTITMHQGTINGITSQRADEEAGVPLATLEDEKATITRAIAEISERRGRHLASFTQMKADKNRLETINREIQHGAKTRAELAELTEKLGLLDKMISLFFPVTQDAINQSVAKGTRLRSALDVLALAEKTDLASLAKADMAMVGLTTADKCPCCGAAGDGWREGKKAELLAAMESIRNNIETNNVQGQATAEELKKAISDHKDMMAEAQRQTDAINSRRDASTRIAALEPSLARYQALEEEKGRLMVDDPNLTATVEAIQTELNIQQDNLRGVERLITQASGRANDLQRMAAAEKLRDEATKLKEQCGLAGKELKAIQAEMVEGAFRPLLATANAIFAGVLPFALEYRDGEIGARAAGVWRGHKTMSGVEKALTYCAIQMALASRSPVRVAVLDEMTKLVSARVPAFAEACMKAIRAGMIDQVLVIDPERGQLYGGIKVPPCEGDFSFNVIAVE